MNVSFHSYTDVMLKDFVDGLVSPNACRKISEKIVYYDNLKRGDRSAKKKLSINDMLVEVNDFLGEHDGYDVFAESGDMLFGGLEVRLRNATASITHRVITHRWGSRSPQRSPSRSEQAVDRWFSAAMVASR